MTTPSRRFDILNPVEGRDGKTRWTRIGVVFRNEKGTLSGELLQSPLNGRIVIRESTPRPKAADPESE